MLVGCMVAATIGVGFLPGQTPSRGTPPAERGAAQTAGRAGGTSSAQVHGNLAQVMKGILYSNSNVIFFVQDKSPVGVKSDGDPSTSVNPLATTYGGWEAVENSGLALAEAANLLTIPGRKCANGRPVPLQNPDWTKFVQGLRDAGMTVYKAAQSKNQDKMLDAADVMTTACANCHDKYREKPNLADRCQ
ncbi:MAG TPA: hypothetical protein VER98_18735, partial [Terriglobia bacterium]|nr:hypothetical protein [Terriglobia bacterium]